LDLSEIKLAEMTHNDRYGSWRNYIVQNEQDCSCQSQIRTAVIEMSKINLVKDDSE